MIELTESAKQHIKKVLEQEGADVFKLSLSQKGCTGYAYVMGVGKRDDLVGGWEVGESDGVVVAVAAEAVARVSGSKLDWIRDGMSSRLEVVNPQVTHACGCGASVMFKP